MTNKGIIIFSPSKYSLYTLCVAKMCIDQKIPVAGIIVLKLFNFQRFKSEFRRDGDRLLKKIWKKFFLKEKAYNNKRFNIVNLKQALNLDESNIVNFASKNRIELIFCDNFNDIKIEKFLKKIKPEIALFTGGGIIKNKIINNFKIGIVNCHMGLLPDYRGMDVVEWPILEKNFKKLGLTTHLMDTGIDTGRIIQKKEYKLKSQTSIKNIRNDYETLMCNLLIEAYFKLQNNEKLLTQNFSDGKQYFIMHKKLKHYANMNIIKKK